MIQNALFPIIVLALMSPNTFADAHDASPKSTTLSGKNVQKEHMDAIEIILQDHNQIRSMIAQLNKSLDSNISQSRILFKELKDFLIKHETMEQKVWYPELEKFADLKDIITKLKKEEQDAGDELKKLDNITDDKEWVSKARKLNKDVEHHAKDEETILFPKVKKLLDKSSLDQIGTKLKDFKNQN